MSARGQMQKYTGAVGMERQFSVVKCEATCISIDERVSRSS